MDLEEEEEDHEPDHEAKERQGLIEDYKTKEKKINMMMLPQAFSAACREEGWTRRSTFAVRFSPPKNAPVTANH